MWQVNGKFGLEIATDLGVVTGVEIARRTGIPERTVQRGTEELRKEQKAERGELMDADLAAGVPQAEIAET